MPSQYVPYIIILALGLGALLILSPGFKQFIFRAFVGIPNLGFEELPGLLNDQQLLNIERNPPKKLPGAHKSLQAYNERFSIIYHMTREGDSVFTETIDISYPGKAGMILTFRNGRLKVFERIGGSVQNDPSLSAEEKNSLNKFMKAARDYFDKV